MFNFSDAGLRALLISDAIAKYVEDIDGLTVLPFRGARLQDIERKVKRGEFSNNYSHVILHVGTNDICSDNSNKIFINFKFLIKACLNYFVFSKIIISSILPRPVDFLSTKNKCIEINQKLNSYCLSNNVGFVKSYKRFLKEGQPIRHLFAKQDGLHLSFEGTKQLRWCLINTVRHLYSK